MVYRECARKIGRITLRGKITEYLLAATSHPSDITVGPDKNLWITDTGTNKIGKFVP